MLQLKIYANAADGVAAAASFIAAETAGPREGTRGAGMAIIASLIIAASNEGNII